MEVNSIAHPKWSVPQFSLVLLSFPSDKYFPINEPRSIPHYVCPLASSLLCGSIPMCQLANCGWNGKEIDPYKFK